MIPERLNALRDLMRERGIAMYMIPTADFHDSEYAGEYFKERRFMSGFTGSAGTLLVTMTEAGLWTDARYFLQAAQQLKGSEITLYRMGEEGVPTIEEYIREHLAEQSEETEAVDAVQTDGREKKNEQADSNGRAKKNEQADSNGQTRKNEQSDSNGQTEKKDRAHGPVIGFDGRTVTEAQGRKLAEIAEEKGGHLHVDEDLVDLIWTDRPPMSKEPAWILDMKYAGESTADKLQRVRKEMEEKGADVHLLSSLTDIAWLLNVRGHDVESVPVVLSYLALTANECIWFVQEEALTDEVRAYLAENRIQTRAYDEFYTYIRNLETEVTSEDRNVSSGKEEQTKRAEVATDANQQDAQHSGISVWIDTSTLNYRACSSIYQLKEGQKSSSESVEQASTQDNAKSTITIIDAPNPTEYMKAIKNPTELENIRSAHVKDAVAMCKFMYWLKTNIGKIPMTEISASDYLADLRAQQEGFIELSFDTICGYADHGAIIHYSATPQTDVPLAPEGFLLVDSGGHYIEGTTDITRTFALGPLTDEMKADFTRVCRSNINLANTRFLHGCTGRNLDVIAREPFWEVNLDYKHGTGHGVGYVLSVHEGPNAFRWQNSKTAQDPVYEEGMVTSDEPGIYLEGKYGIRTESEIVCRKGEKNEYGQFMEFENITYVPIDLDALVPEQMSPVERARLNAYHAKVYEVVAPYLAEDEREFLKEYTREI